MGSSNCSVSRSVEGRHLDDVASAQEVRGAVVLVGQPAHRERRHVVPRLARVLREPAVPDAHLPRPVQPAHRVGGERHIEAGPHAGVRHDGDAGASGVGIEPVLFADDAGVPAEIHHVRADGRGHAREAQVHVVVRGAQDGLRAGELRRHRPRIRGVGLPALRQPAAGEGVHPRGGLARGGVAEVEKQDAGCVSADGEIKGRGHTLAARADNGIRERHETFSFLTAPRGGAHRLNGRKPAERRGQSPAERAHSRPGVHVKRRAASITRGLRQRVCGRVGDRHVRQRLGGPVLGET